MRRRALGDLAFMVRKQVVLAACVNVEGGAQVSRGHRGALDVPPGESSVQPCVKLRSLRGLALPQCVVVGVELHEMARVDLPQREVLGAAFAGVHRDPGARALFIHVAARERPIAGEARDIEVGLAVHQVRVSPVE